MFLYQNSCCLFIQDRVRTWFKTVKKHKSFIQINNNEIKKEEFKLHQTTSGVVSCHPALLYPTEMICSNSMTESWLTHTTKKNQTLCGRVCVCVCDCGFGVFSTGTPASTYRRCFMSVTFTCRLSQSIQKMLNVPKSQQVLVLVVAGVLRLSFSRQWWR